MIARRSPHKPPRPVSDWSRDHPVARAMRTGSGWFQAWVSERATPLPLLAKRTRLPMRRLLEIDAGGRMTRDEIAKLAEAWAITPEGLLASMPDPSRVVG